MKCSTVTLNFVAMFVVGVALIGLVLPFLFTTGNLGFIGLGIVWGSATPALYVIWFRRVMKLARKR